MFYNSTDNYYCFCANDYKILPSDYTLIFQAAGNGFSLILIV